MGLKKGVFALKLKIMTYNIRSGHPVDTEQAIKEFTYDLSKAASVIAEMNPDICGLNEVDNHQERTAYDNQAAKLASAWGTEHYYFSKATSFPENSDNEYGNAVLSKFPIIEKETILPPPPEQKDESTYYEQRGIARVVVKLPGGQTLTVLQTHFGLAIGERQKMLELLLPLIDSIETPLLLMGDFNIRPADWLLNPLRERLTEVSEALGAKPFRTFPTYKTDYPDCKIDYVFVSKHFKPLFMDIKQTQASDHFPYYVELELQDK